MIFVWNDNGDQRFLFPEKFRTIQSQVFSLLDLNRNSHSVIMSLDGTLSCIKCIHLTFRIFCCGILMTSPVVKNPWNMTDILSSCCFHTTEHKIIILCTIKFLSQHTNLIDQFFFYHKKMTDIVYCTQKINIEIRFKMRLEKLMAIHGHLVLIGIQYFDLFLLIQCLYTLKQSIRCQLIIMICKGNKISCCCPDRPIGILCDLKSLCITDHTNPGITFFHRSQKL